MKRKIRSTFRKRHKPTLRYDSDTVRVMLGGMEKLVSFPRNRGKGAGFLRASEREGRQ